MVWVIGCLLIAITAYALSRPILRARAVDPGRAEYDLAIYRDQLAELERDLAAGLIGPAEAKGARTEIQRRMLAADDRRQREGSETDQRVQRRSRLVAAALVFGLLPGGALWMYAHLGSPSTPDFPLAAREVAGESQARAQNGAAGNASPQTAANPDAGEGPAIDDLIARLRARLADNPTEIEGWLLLARTLGTLGRYGEQADALTAAIDASPDSAVLKAALGEALTQAAEGLVTEPARAAFEAALAADPNDPRARYYLGVADAQAGKTDAALARWIALDRESAPDAPYRRVLRNRIADTARAAGRDPDAVLAEAGPPIPDSPPRPSNGAGTDPVDALVDDVVGPGETQTGPRGPTASDVAAAAEMSPDDRMAMIQSMVAGLSDRLRENPDDRDGWERLVRSQMVLGESAKALEAMERYAAQFPNDIDLQIQFGRTAVTVTPETAPLPASLGPAMDRVLAADPSHEEALWYRGLVAARQGDSETARRNWEALRSLLPADSENLPGVDAALAGLKG